ncbi:MAG TPA: DUF4177 domain-containing protein [Verrucomicrobiae bacterium]|nr:DUF4177 domain-containing protein [Verrucomicrobiae bacterium]
MKKCVSLVIVAGALALAGCCSITPSSKWEYKVVRLSRGGDANHVEAPEAVRQAQETLLNDLGKEGWVLVSQTDGRFFYFKRAVR